MVETGYEGGSLNLTCPAGQFMSGIWLANYGTPDGTVPVSTCSLDVKPVVEAACLGLNHCDVPVTNASMGADPCVNTPKYLNAAAICSTPVNTTDALPIDCGAWGLPGKNCWGYSDGIMNPKTGLLRNDDGVILASYLIRCALPANDTVNLMDYTGHVLHFKGELGLAPAFKTTGCDTTCQENVSACLMALTNGKGQHVQLELSSVKNALGGGHNSTYGWQEGAFYGNIFSTPPNGFFCNGSGQDNIATMWYAYDSNFDARMCENYQSGNCPYKMMGDCTAAPWSPQACTTTGALGSGEISACKGDARTFSYTYSYPLTYSYTYSTAVVPTTSLSYTYSYSTTSTRAYSWMAWTTKITTFTTTSTSSFSATVTNTTTATTTGTNTTTNTSTGSKTYQYPIVTYLKAAI